MIMLLRQINILTALNTQLWFVTLLHILMSISFSDRTSKETRKLPIFKNTFILIMLKDPCLNVNDEWDFTKSQCLEERQGSFPRRQASRTGQACLQVGSSKKYCHLKDSDSPIKGVGPYCFVGNTTNDWEPCFNVRKLN